MNIGIMTFHWATNYGAILQAYALQNTLLGMGHEVEIINYKPLRYEASIWRFIWNKGFMHPFAYLHTLRKERRMVPFRQTHLNCSESFASVEQLQKECQKYDALIAGSDQVMNPSFLAYGERGGSTAYFLNFGRQEAIRMTYAVSFGTTHYPDNFLAVVSPLIRRFQALSVRENSGLDILASMGRTDATVVPDPTLLLTAKDYDSAFDLSPKSPAGTLVYMLHHRLGEIQDRLPSDGDILTISDESVEEWIQAIRNSRYVVTNSFHGMVFAILYHVPFTVVLKSPLNEGMNDRFFTLLCRLGLEERIMCEQNYCINHNSIDWEDVEARISMLRRDGMTFLERALMGA